MFFMRSQHLLHHLWLPAQLQGVGPLPLQVLRPHQPSWRSIFNSLQSGHRQPILEPESKTVNWTLKSYNFSPESRLFCRKSTFTASILSMRIRPQDRTFFAPNFKVGCTDKKENKIFIIYLEIQSGVQLQSNILYEEGLPNIWGNAKNFPHIWGGRYSYITLQLLHSEFPYIWGKFSFLFYQCVESTRDPLLDCLVHIYYVGNLFHCHMYTVLFPPQHPLCPPASLPSQIMITGSTFLTTGLYFAVFLK